MQDLSVIIVAGGSGSRMNAAAPKQFLTLCGKPVLMVVLETFYSSLPGIRIVVPIPDPFRDSWEKLVSEYRCTIPHQVVSGGETRFHSVRNGLQFLPDDGLTGIHDSARALATPALIKRVFDMARKYGNAVPAIRIGESLRSEDRSGNHPELRDRFRIIQTPQVFATPVLKQAYRQEYRETFTDDATVVGSLGESIHLADGDPENLKITHPVDLAIAQAILDYRKSLT